MVTFTFKESTFNLYKIRLFFTYMYAKSASQKYMTYFHNPKIKIKAHKWIIVYTFYVNIFH